MTDDRALGRVTNPSGTERLHEYWVHGEGAAKIGWGTPGDFDRCVLHLGKFLRDPKGYCNLAHHAATGMYPAQHAEMIKAGRSAVVAPEIRAQMTAQSINDLPDSDFAYIEPGGSKDSSGKTVPRSLRHFPVHDAAHVRNALARAPQSPFGDKAMPKIRAAAKKFGIDEADDTAGRSLAAVAERRYTPGVVEVRASDAGKRIGGYGAVFGKLSRNLGGFVERVGEGAFNQSRSVGWPNVVCRYNHDANMVLGTTAGGTLTLQTDSVGLNYEVIPPNARADILELVERRDIQFSSFAFRVPPGGDEWSVTDQNYPMRTLHEVQLVDVAPVLDPAYPDATAGLRSLALAMDAPFDDVAELASADELRRFFVRTDRPSYVPPKPKITGAAAMMKLMEKKFPELG